MKLFFFIKTGMFIVIFTMMWNFSFAGVPPCHGGGSGEIDPLPGKNLNFTRTFKQTKLKNSTFIQKSTKDWGPEVTYNDIIENYENNKSIEFSWKIAEETPFSMNIGIIDHENPQTWTMPDFGLTTEPAGLSVDISTLDFIDEFPGTTHAKKFSYPDGDLYELYEVTNDEIYVVGTYNTYANDDPEITLIEEIYAPLPFGVGYDYYYEFEYDMVDSIYLTCQEIEFDGYGTINTPNGTHEDVIKIRTHLNDTIFDLDYNVMETFEYDIITFYGKDGFRLNLYLEEGSVTSENVDIKYIEQERILSSSEIDEKFDSQIQIYPNPTKDIVNLSEKIDFKLYDIKGNLVKFGKNAKSCNLNDLEDGTYILKSNNISRKIIKK